MMMHAQETLSRRNLMAGAASLALTIVLAKPASAGIFDGKSAKSMLGNASDNALDKLGKPGAFYADTAVRILLPGTSGKLASRLMKAGDKFGLTTKLTKSLNEAAGLAALEAKPVFRKSIDSLTLNDVPGLVTQNDGATQYLKKSAGGDLHAKVRPLISAALTKVGAYDQMTKLQKTTGSLMSLAKLDNESLTDSVAKQAMNGIFSYMGKEEAGLRGNVGNLGKVLGDIIK
jgi:Protein of unknown function (DUF4197)